MPLLTHEQVQDLLPKGWILGDCIRQSKYMGGGLYMEGYKCWPNSDSEDTKRTFFLVILTIGKVETVTGKPFESLAEMDQALLEAKERGDEAKKKREAERQERDRRQDREAAERFDREKKERQEARERERLEARARADERRRQRREEAEALERSKQDPRWGMF
jgi:hypothetical protein